MTILPAFSNIKPSNFPEQLSILLAQNLQKIATILQNNLHFTWENLIYPLECMEDELEKLWSPISHLHAVVNTKELRTCYEACLPKLSEYESAIGQNKALYNAIKSLDQTTLNSTQRKIIQDQLLAFRLSGVALDTQSQARFQLLSTRLSELSNQFENNVLDATNSYELHWEKQLDSLPEHAYMNARALAEKKNLPGLILTLDYPCYVAVMTYADDRKLRETMYHAFVTRASDQGPDAKRFDNTLIIDEILSKRHELAQLLGFANYAELSLATKMAETPLLVNKFLLDLAHKAYPQAQQEYRELQEYAQQSMQLQDLAPWDLAYVSEKKRQECYAISQEEFRAYFPLQRVLSGLFSIVQTLYGMQFTEVQDFDKWHPDVLCYSLCDEKNTMRGYIYLDLLARPHKRGGAWMNSCQSRFKKANGEIQLPIATLTCNFAKPAKNKPVTLLHDEVITLFHEFGHCLQHVLTTVDYLGASGIEGVEWDAVELPSQFFENWCWDQRALTLLSSHIETKESLSEHQYQQLLAAKNFQSAMGMMRQLEFSLFDFQLHEDDNHNDTAFVCKILTEVRKITSIVPVVEYSRFQHSFTHIFGGGYAAGYYSYKWAEVLSSDAFAKFEEEGIFNPKTGRDFLHKILEVGGSCPAIEAFEAFRGRKPHVDALLRHNGIAS
jgi:oligopeptidase A